MLVLTRRPGEDIIIADNIRISIVSVKGDRVRIGIAAPADVSVDRAEVHARRQEFHDIPLGIPVLAGHGDESSVNLGSSPAPAAGDTIRHS